MKGNKKQLTCKAHLPFGKYLYRVISSAHTVIEKLLNLIISRT